MHWLAALVLAVAGVALGGAGEGRSLWIWWAAHSVVSVLFGCSLVYAQVPPPEPDTMWNVECVKLTEVRVSVCLQRHMVATQAAEGASNILFLAAR
eukprot:1976504-Rhodomonas_salina.5